MLKAVHALIDPGADSKHPPLDLVRDDELGLIGIAESTGKGPDAQVAARMVLDVIENHLKLHADLVEKFRRRPTDMLRNEIISTLQDAVGRAGREAFALKRRRGLYLGVGVDLVLVAHREAFAAHVGYGQIYLFRRDLLHRLALTTPRRSSSEDAPSNMSDEPRTNQPLALLGREPSVHIETLCLAFSPGDRVVLASPGMVRALDDRDIRTLSGALPPAQAIQGLLHLAREKARSEPLGLVMHQVPGDAQNRQKSSQTRLTVLSRMPLFNYCSPEELLAVAAVTHPQRAHRNSEVFRQGEPGQEIYLIVSGEIAVLRDGMEITRLGPGSSFGEMSILDEPRRSATVLAVTDTELLVIRREAFFSLLMGNPTLAVKILWNMLLRLSEDLRQTTGRLAELTPASSDEPTMSWNSDR